MTTDFIGMDVHKDSYTVCCYAMGEKNAWGTTKLNADYKEVLRYIDSAKAYYDLNAKVVCGLYWIAQYFVNEQC